MNKNHPVKPWVRIACIQMEIKKKVYLRKSSEYKNIIQVPHNHALQLEIVLVILFFKVIENITIKFDIRRTFEFVRLVGYQG